MQRSQGAPSVQRVQETLLVAPVQLTRVLGLVNSAELIVFRRKIVGQVRQEVEV